MCAILPSLSTASAILAMPETRAEEIFSHVRLTISIQTFLIPSLNKQTIKKMKFTATVVAASVVAVSAFSPVTTIVRVSQHLSTI